jgi:phasin family protein
MPTPRPPAKRPARKAAAAQPAAKRKLRTQGKTVSSSRVEPSASAEAADNASLVDLVARLGKLQLAGFAGKLVQGWRMDLESIMQASRTSYAGLEAIVSRQTAQIKEAIGEIQSVGMVVREVGVKTSARNLDDLALASLELALADVRELAAMAAQSQREAFEIVQRRVTENVDEVQRLLRK